MIRIEAQPNIEEIKRLVFQLPVQDLMMLVAEIEERLSTTEMMQIAESGFQEWNDDDEAIYDADS